jgi:hypothetical protein
MLRTFIDLDHSTFEESVGTSLRQLAGDCPLRAVAVGMLTDAMRALRSPPASWESATDLDSLAHRDRVERSIYRALDWLVSHRLADGATDELAIVEALLTDEPDPKPPLDWDQPLPADPNWTSPNWPDEPAWNSPAQSNMIDQPGHTPTSAGDRSPYSLLESKLDQKPVTKNANSNTSLPEDEAPRDRDSRQRQAERLQRSRSANRCRPTVEPLQPRLETEQIPKPPRNRRPPARTPGDSESNRDG